MKRDVDGEDSTVVGLVCALGLIPRNMKALSFTLQDRRLHLYFLFYMPDDNCEIFAEDTTEEFGAIMTGDDDFYDSVSYTVLFDNKKPFVDTCRGERHVFSRLENSM